MLNFLLAIGSGSGTPSNSNWNQYEPNNFTEGFIIGLLTGIGLCIALKILSWIFKKILNHISTPKQSKSDK